MFEAEFPALPHVYKWLYVYLEPLSTVMPAILVWTVPGAGWFHNELVPGGINAHAVPVALDARTTMAIWQLGNCYFLLGLLGFLGYRAVRDAMPGNFAAQERITGATLTALAIADVTHMIATWVALPPSARAAPGSWNATTHGNLTFVVILLVGRLAWFAGVGRTRYYYGVRSPVKKAN